MTLCSTTTVVFSEGDPALTFFYGETELLSQGHPSMLTASKQQHVVNSVFPGLAGRWEQTFLKQFLVFLAFVALRPIYPATAMSCRALPSILCVDVEIAASRPLMVTAWGELSWHKECRSALLAFGARCLLISGDWSNASSGVGVEKGIWAVKSRMGKRGQAWLLLSALQDLLTAEALRGWVSCCNTHGQPCDLSPDSLLTTLLF